MPSRFPAISISLLFLFTAACSDSGTQDAMKTAQNTLPQTASPTPPSTCTGTYPSYFQDPAFSHEGMWDGQVIINQPPPDWQGPVFRLSDGYSTAVPESGYPWQQFNPFDPGLSPEQRTLQAQGYIWALMSYIQEGNTGNADIGNDWTLCNNQVRPWFHIPFQTYEPLSGREFIHGLTREAPVTSVLANGDELKTTIWAVGFYNPAAGQTLGTVWTSAKGPTFPQHNLAFNEGSVIGKLLFTTATPEQYPFLNNVPAWRANISAPEFCACTSSTAGACSFAEETEQCPRTEGQVYLLQFDVAVRDSRSPVGWAYGTFVADGQRKASEANPWKRISALGLMWGNDTPPLGTGAAYYPEDPRNKGFKDGVIFWDAVTMLNARTNAGHLGCNSRLNGPADNAQSSCLSCHQTASVPDTNNKTPAIMYQFGGFKNDNGQCMSKPDALDLDIDQTYFQTARCSESFTGPASVLPPPQYASGQPQWISTDFSLQLSISLTQWQEWQQDLEKQQQGETRRVFDGVLPAR